MQKIRLKQSNLIGPAGLISMEDGEAVEMVHHSVLQAQNETSYIAMGGGKSESTDHLVTEAAIIAFWNTYRETMELDEGYTIQS
jgi:anthranilate 1,2-dioxygenase large subunit